MKLHVLLILPLSCLAPSVLSGCSGTPDSNIEVVDDIRPLKKKEVEELKDFGASGQGWAYDVLSGDAKDRGDDVASQIWAAKALQAGSSESCAKYAEKLLKLSREMKNGESKEILLNEAKSYAVTAIKNSFKYPLDIDDKKGKANLAISTRILTDINSSISNSN